MKSNIEILDNIINDINNQINDKILGINYLEKIKYLLIIEIQKANLDFSMGDLGGQKITKKYGGKELTMSLERYNESTSKIKQTLSCDFLSLIIKGSKSLEIYENINSKKSNLINLFKNNGITLSKDTIISEVITKNTILLNIFNSKNNNDIEN